MIISRNGDILFGYDLRDGIIVHDGKYAICLDYNETQKEQFGRINELKNYLSNTDYQAIKFSDGAISEEDYAPIREQRKEARAEINRIEEVFVKPTITEEEMKKAEEEAERKMAMGVFEPVLVQ